MAKNRARFVPGGSFAEERLEQRLVLSGAGVALAHAGAEVSALAVKNAATKTSLAVNAGTLGQPITFTVTVRTASSAGSPAGSVRILDRGRLIAVVPVSPTQSADGTVAASTATYTLTQPPGGAAYYFGKHRVSAVFVPSAGFAKSTASGAFTVNQPSYTALGGGVKAAAVAFGAGTPIQVGQTANVLYTGYLAKSGRVFDNSSSHGNVPLQFKVGSGQVIPGFDGGTLGMRVGETRIILIPPTQGYGSVANGPIPAYSTLIFVVTLQSIS